MKTSDLVADHRTDSLVALAQGWEYIATTDAPRYGRWFKEDEYVISEPFYKPSTTPAQWAELIVVFYIDITWMLSTSVMASPMKVLGASKFVEKAGDIGLAICKAVIAAKWGDTIPDEVWEKVK